MKSAREILAEAIQELPSNRADPEGAASNLLSKLSDHGYVVIQMGR